MSHFMSHFMSLVMSHVMSQYVLIRYELRSLCVDVGHKLVPRPPGVAALPPLLQNDEAQGRGRGGEGEERGGAGGGQYCSVSITGKT